MGRLTWNFQLSFLFIFLLALNVNAGGAIAGKVTILKGKVFFERGGQKIQIKKDDAVLESDIIEAEVGTARITMIDSNLIDIYPRSKITIAKYIYKPNQDQKEVELKVDFGKIKSTVNQKYDGAKSKFQIKTPAAVAGVRGTVFTAEYDRITKVAKVVTIEGLVAVTKLVEGDKQSAPVFVRPNQVVKVDVEQTNTEQPRDLTPEEREKRKKEDKDLGYQYDPKNEPTPNSSAGNQPQPAPPTANNPPSQPPVTGGPPPSQGQPPAGQPATQPATQAGNNQPNQPPATTQTVNRVTGSVQGSSSSSGQTDRQASAEQSSSEAQPKSANREAPVPKEPVKEISTRASAVNNSSDRQQQQQQQARERRQKESEEAQAKKQKQSEDEQAKRQKQLEEEQARKQKQLEEEMIKRQQAEAQRAEAARRQAENTIINNPPSGIGTTIPSPGANTPYQP